MRNKSTIFIAEVAIFSSLAIALDLVCGLLFSFGWLQGGSISIAMFPIFIISIRWGLKGGFASGLIVGLIQIVLPTAYLGGGLFQALFDYVFAFGILGITGLVNISINKAKKSNIVTLSILFMTLAGLLRSIFHIISGMLFFDVPLWGSITYNMAYMIPSIILSVILVVVFMLKAPQLVFPSEEIDY